MDKKSEIQALEERLAALKAEEKANAESQANFSQAYVQPSSKGKGKSGSSGGVVLVGIAVVGFLGIVSILSTVGDRSDVKVDSVDGGNAVIKSGVDEASLEAPVQPAVPVSSWSYRSLVDPMTDKKTYFACTTSSNLVRLDWPYKDVSSDLCIRQSPRYGLDVILQLNGDGQIICRSYDNCNVKIRFGEGEQQTFSANDAADGSGNVIFISNVSRFVSSVKGAKTTKIQITLYQAGDQVVEFNTDNLEWPPKD